MFPRSTVLAFGLIVSTFALQPPTINLNRGSTHGSLALEPPAPDQADIHLRKANYGYPQLQSNLPHRDFNYHTDIANKNLQDTTLLSFVSPASQPFRKRDRRPNSSLTVAALRTVARHSVIKTAALQKQYLEAMKVANLSHQVAQEHFSHDEKWLTIPADQRGPHIPFRHVKVSKEALEWFRKWSVKPAQRDMFADPKEWERERPAYIQNYYDQEVAAAIRRKLYSPNGPVKLLETLQSVGIRPHKRHMALGVGKDGGNGKRGTGSAT